MAVCFVALGSNEGDRKAYIMKALERINALPHTRVIKRSHLFETSPVGGPARQGDYLNAVAKLRTSLSPSRLLTRLQAIERSLGRRRRMRWGPRTIDLDILLYEQEYRQTRRLRLPHPRMFERDFVLLPLCETL